jgi:hypothetical protein
VPEGGTKAGRNRQRNKTQKPKNYLNMKKGIILAGCIAALTASSQAAIVINEIYGGGGNTGAPFNRDFVELFNNGLLAENLAGLQLQYASATGTTFTTFATLPAFTLSAGESFVVTVGPNPTATTPGADVPNVGFSGSTGTNLGAGAGKVQLLAVSVEGTPGAVLDLVGYGTTANSFEGAGPAPAPSNTLSINRVAGVDSNNNAVDFVTAAPSPVPEPSVAIALIGGAGMLLGLRRRR